MSTTTKLVNILSMHGASVSQRILFYTVMAFLLVLSVGVAKANNQDGPTPIISDTSLSSPLTAQITSNVDESVRPLEPISVSGTSPDGTYMRVTINGEKYPVPTSEDIYKAVQTGGTTTQVDIDHQPPNTTTVDEDKANLNSHILASSKGDAENGVVSLMRTSRRD